MQQRPRWTCPSVNLRTILDRMHPSYGSGHATVAGPVVTMLKAIFDETVEIRNPMGPNPEEGANFDSL